MSTSEDPLGAGSVGADSISPTTTSIFDAFAGDARKRAEQNGKRVLDELRAHDEDPLAWLNSGRPHVVPDDMQEKEERVDTPGALSSHGNRKLMSNTMSPNS